MAKKNNRPRQSSTYNLQILVEIDEDGKYVASCPALQGCYSQGGTFEEALANIRDVAEMCLEELREEEKEIDVRYPEIVGLKQIEVTV
jgi:predicted RNase H-like HicB family nuclease